MSQTEARLIVEEGPCSGREFAVTSEAGVRVGRSSSNDVPLRDPSVSRFHCRFFLREGQGLWIADLGSANQTLLNGKPVLEQRVFLGDRVAIGDSIIKVVSDGTGMPAAARVEDGARVETAAPAAPANAGAKIDLGLAAAKPSAGRKPNILFLIVLAALAAAFALVVWIPKAILRKPAGGGAPPPPVALMPADIAVRYERIEGSATNIFQYLLVIEEGKAGIELHDLANNRHFSRPMSPVDGEVILRVARAVEDSDFFAVEPEHTGRTPGVYDLKDLSVTIGRRTHRARVFNLVEPPAFESARKTIEQFGLDQFGMTAWARPRAELINMARDSELLARKLYDEKGLRYGNLFLAMKELDKASLYLETIDPKPDFYEDVLTLRRIYEEELKKNYDDLQFQITQAIKLKDWREAARLLEMLCEVIPDRDHEWHKEAKLKLINVQRYIGR